MTTTGSEKLYWDHIQNEDYAGAAAVVQDAKKQPAPAELLKMAASDYLDGAVASGEVTTSTIFEHMGRIAGYTTVETGSGVKIVKYSDGSLNLNTEYEEPIPGGSPGDYHDLSVEIELPVANRPIVREDRRKVIDHDATGEGGEKTLGRRDAERVMGDVAKLITQIF